MVRGKQRKEDKIEKDEAVDAIPAQVLEVLGKTGVYGEINQVMARMLAGRDKGRVVRRNVKGPVHKDDILMLIDTESEAKSIRAK
jgi:small subunit ribosomal protein S28e